MLAIFSWLVLKNYLIVPILEELFFTFFSTAEASTFFPFYMSQIKVLLALTMLGKLDLIFRSDKSFFILVRAASVFFSIGTSFSSCVKLFFAFSS